MQETLTGNQILEILILGYNEAVENGTLGRTIREHRRSRGWKQAELSRRTGIDQSYISQLENDRLRRPSAETLSRIAHAFNIPLEDLLKLAVPDNSSEVDEAFSPVLARIREIGLSPEHEQLLLRHAEALKALEEQERSQPRKAKRHESIAVNQSIKRPDARTRSDEADEE